MKKPLVLKSYAKINLCLYVKGKRPDNYHEIETIFQTVDLYDEITLKIRKDSRITIQCNNPAVPATDENLCYQAAQVMQSFGAGPPPGVDISLAKKIPIGAGLGGGSSNAAAVLKGLNWLWELKVPETELFKAGIRLGADVPFFIKGGTAYATGKGEKLTFLENPFNLWALIAYPALQISTAWAYKNLKLDLTRTGRNIKLSCFQNRDLKKFRSLCTNDFESLIFDNFPKVKSLKEELMTLGANCALLSGSGSAVFGLFTDQTAAQKAGQILNSPPVIVFLARFINAQ
jgi:4-diphosphocytidyl-2-C-methyl-D-erythritol kinase